MSRKLIFILILSGLTSLYSFGQQNQKGKSKTTKKDLEVIIALQNYKYLILESRALTIQWAYNQSGKEVAFKSRLKNIHKVSLDSAKSVLEKMAVDQHEGITTRLFPIFKEIQQLVVMENDVIELLYNYQAYEDPKVVAETKEICSSDGDIQILSKKIIAKIDMLIEEINSK